MARIQQSESNTEYADLQHLRRRFRWPEMIAPRALVKQRGADQQKRHDEKQPATRSSSHVERDHDQRQSQSRRGSGSPADRDWDCAVSKQLRIEAVGLR